jgi:alpha-1,2-mannosyltransferase
MWGILRRGTWLTPDRLAIYPRMLLAAFGLALVALFATSHGTRDATGRMLGTDFSQVWAAGRSVLEGHPVTPFDVMAHVAAQQRLFGPHEDVYGWLYPPYFLAPAALLACLPYVPALVAWQAATLPLYLVATLRILRGLVPAAGTTVAALAFPAVFVNIGHGNNGFLTAGLLAGGLLTLPRRPLLAGVMFGLLAYKPQFGLMLPIALVAGGCWRTALAAAATVVAITIATLAAFGAEAWTAFFRSLSFTRDVVLEQGSPGWHKLQSAFAAVRMLGGSVTVAYAVQGVAILLVSAALVGVWRSRADMGLKSAALLAATVLGTPYCFDYDMVVLGPALAFAVADGIEKGFGPFEKTLLAIVWIMPLVARSIASTTLFPMGLLVTTAFFLLIARRAWSAPVKIVPPDSRNLFLPTVKA